MRQDLASEFAHLFGGHLWEAADPITEEIDEGRVILCPSDVTVFWLRSTQKKGSVTAPKLGLRDFNSVQSTSLSREAE